MTTKKEINEAGLEALEYVAERIRNGSNVENVELLFDDSDSNEDVAAVELRLKFYLPR